MISVLNLLIIASIPYSFFSDINSACVEEDSDEIPGSFYESPEEDSDEISGSFHISLDFIDSKYLANNQYSNQN